MKKFHFALQPLLRLRKINEEKALNKFAQWTRKRNALEDKIRAINRTLHQQIDEEDWLQTSDNSDNIDHHGVMLEQRILKDRYVQFLESQRVTHQRELAQMQPPWQEARENFINARKQRQILSVIEERRLAEYHTKVRKWNNRQNTEINQINQSQEKWAAS